jgi:CRP/FNR family transcriptional regulator
MEQLFTDLPTRQLSRGQILIYEGDPIDNIYYLLDGYVKVSSLSVDGSQRTIFIYAPGDAFPLAGYLSGVGIARYFYECMTGAEIKVMPQKRFQEIIKGDLELGEQLISYTYQLNAKFAERIETLTARSARRKIVSLLSFLADRTGTAESGRVRLNVPLTSQEIADMCSLTRETTSLQMQKLRKERVIRGGRYLSVDIRKLEKILIS